MAKMVQLAIKARSNNRTTDQIILQTLEQKRNLLKTRMIDCKTMCSKVKINNDTVNVLFDGISLGLNEVNVTITDDDIKTGFMMLSAVAYCSDSGKVPLSLSQRQWHFPTSCTASSPPRAQEQSSRPQSTPYSLTISSNHRTESG